MTVSNGAPRSGALPFYYVMVVWGEKYVDMLLEVALPCLLAPGNLPGLPNLGESRFLVMTTPRDQARIAASPAFRSLQAVVETSFVDSPWLALDIPYHFKAARAHQDAAKRAANGNAYCVFLAPDFLLSDGSLRSLVGAARAGKHAVMVSGIRVVTESILEEIRGTYTSRSGDALAIAPRKLVELCLRHVHAENQRYNWDHPCFSTGPVVCTWNVPGEIGLLVRAFHLHPLMLKMMRSESAALLEENTIDGEFLGFNCPDWDAIHVETDSDNIALFSLTARWERYQRLVPNTASVGRLGNIAFSVSVNPLHRHYFTKAIRLHAGDLNSAWSQVEEQTGLLAYRALRFDENQRAPNLQTLPLPGLLQYIEKLLREIAKRMVRRLWRYVRKVVSILTPMVSGRKRVDSPAEEIVRLEEVIKESKLEIERLRETEHVGFPGSGSGSVHCESRSETRAGS